MKLLEEEREKWAQTYELKATTIEQLERELTATVEANAQLLSRANLTDSTAVSKGGDDSREEGDSISASAPSVHYEPTPYPVGTAADAVAVSANQWASLQAHNSMLGRELSTANQQIANLAAMKEQLLTAVKDQEGKLQFRLTQVWNTCNGQYSTVQYSTD
jgi:hypothetical protein